MTADKRFIVDAIAGEFRECCFGISVFNRQNVLHIAVLGEGEQHLLGYLLTPLVFGLGGPAFCGRCSGI